MQNKAERKFGRLRQEEEWAVFYPKGYVVVIFPGDGDVAGAMKALIGAGWQTEDVVPFTSADIITRYEQHQKDQGLLQKLQSAMAEFGQEAQYLRDLVDRAKAGDQFLMVYAPELEQANLVRDTLRPFEPRKLTLYKPEGIVDVV
jgi:hypothetical protein